MYEKILNATTIPVLEQVVAFSQARHNVLAGNIANLDTPGYKVRDLSTEDFQSRLRSAMEARRRPAAAMSPGEPGFGQNANVAEVARESQTILRHDEVNVGVERQVTEMAKNQIQHNLALTIMTAQFRLLNAAISERV
ncbi:MAG: flagellar basal body rod protein FlgB [Pirellulales bacterium]|nr:flagellar basal body rod protein FlgB [Pirellulales bacterium]